MLKIRSQSGLTFVFFSLMNVLLFRGVPSCRKLCVPLLHSQITDFLKFEEIGWRNSENAVKIGEICICQMKHCSFLKDTIMTNNSCEYELQRLGVVKNILNGPTYHRESYTHFFFKYPFSEKRTNICEGDHSGQKSPIFFFKEMHS